MNHSIPTTIGMLSLSFIGAGCDNSPAAKYSRTFEKVCKDQCDCPEAMEDWNDISNCKKACEGYALYQEAINDEQRTPEPCAEFDEILQELEECSVGVCGYDYNPNCDYTVYYRLQECWPYDYTYNPTPYSPYGYAGASEDQRELMRKLLQPIPVASMGGQALHQASN